MLQWHHLQAGQRLAWCVGGRHESACEAMTGSFPQALFAVMHRADFAGQAYLTEADHAVGRRKVAKTGVQREQHRQVGPGFSDPHAPHHVDEHIVIGQRDAAMAVQYRQHHGQPVVLQAQRYPPGIVQVARIDQGLYFEQDGTGAFANHRDNAARNRPGMT